jgi:hypothetical protein
MWSLIARSSRCDARDEISRQPLCQHSPASLKQSFRGCGPIGDIFDLDKELDIMSVLEGSGHCLGGGDETVLQRLAALFAGAWLVISGSIAEQRRASQGLLTAPMGVGNNPFIFGGSFGP